MRHRILLFVLLLLLCGCGQKADMHSDPVQNEMKEYSFEGTVFRYDDQEYDLSERESAINSILMATPVGQYIVVEGHIGPKVGMYCIFDTEQMTFVRDLVGTSLIWREDDIRTCLYVSWSDVCDYDGNVVASLDLKEPEFVYEIRFGEEPETLEVEIATESGFRTELLTLEGNTL